MTIFTVTKVDVSELGPDARKGARTKRVALFSVWLARG
jgi:hypothetical protein